jgi:hypothetical protein
MEEFSQLFEKKEIVSVLSAEYNLQQYINDYSLNRKNKSHSSIQQSSLQQQDESPREGPTNMEGSLDSQGPGANEAMYFDIPPLNESQFIILDNEEALGQQTKLLVESQNLNNRQFPPWDDSNFSKIKFYTKEIDINQEYQQ